MYLQVCYECGIGVFHACLSSIARGIQIAPVDLASRSVFLLQPVIRSFEMTVA